PWRRTSRAIPWSRPGRCRGAGSPAPRGSPGGGPRTAAPGRRTAQNLLPRSLCSRVVTIQGGAGEGPGSRGCPRSSCHARRAQEIYRSVARRTVAGRSYGDGMPLTQYYTATTLDGFIADPDNSLQWLFDVPRAEVGSRAWDDFIGAVGSMAMGSTTY